MDRTSKTSAGEALAAELRCAVQKLGLLNVMTVRYVPGEEHLRLVWIRGKHMLDVPATGDWAARVQTALPVYAQARRRLSVVPSPFPL